ncbi:hypothetical protein V2J09_018087 [Rumex salicifolius]
MSSLSSSSSSSWFVLSSLLSIFILARSEDARIKLPPNVTFSAILGFGDSIIDPGNNNYIKTMLKCNFSPYGRDFAGGHPTGRFSNGRIPTDFIVEELGIKSYLPAYLDPSLKAEELLTGVSFASGASGYDPLTPVIASVISLTEQLSLFKEYVGKLNKIVGESKTKSIIKGSIFIIVAGSDDIANTYFDSPFRKKSYDLDSYSDLMVESASSFIRNLYGVGARRMAVFSAPPIGCVPSQRTLAGGVPLRMCANDYNQLAQLFNSKLDSKMSSMKPHLPQSRLVYVDIYAPLLDIILFPAKYGLEEVKDGCCGTGMVEVSVLCNKLDSVCTDPTKYLFWDSFHPTERGYQILTQIILRKYVTSLI